MSSHSRSIYDSRHSASQGTHDGSRRGVLYLLASIVVAALFVFAAESHARQIEYILYSGVAVDGTINEINVVQSGGRHPGYWIAGTYPAVSPAGRDLLMPFRFNITKTEYDSYTQGDTVDLIYAPDSYNVPLRAANYAQFEASQIRLFAAVSVAVYGVIAGTLMVIDRRRQTRRAAASSKLHRAFGSR